MFEGIVKGWGNDRRQRVKLEKANAELEQKYSLSEQEKSTIQQKEPVNSFELDHGFLLAPRTETDVVAMGFSLVDGTRTSITVVNDAVDIDNISNGPIPGSHAHIISYHIEGKAHRAKAPYHLAVFQVYLKGAGDAEPILNSERGME
jgi:hypothetical protein